MPAGGKSRGEGPLAANGTHRSGARGIPCRAWGQASVVDLSDEEKARILAEERVRAEARAQAEAELHQRRAEDKTQSTRPNPQEEARRIRGLRFAGLGVFLAVLAVLGLAFLGGAF